MGESPRWHDGRLWMCDWLAGEVLAFGTDGSREVMARVEGLPFSIDWLPDGRLVATTPTGVVVDPDLAPYGPSGQPFHELVVDAVGPASGLGTRPPGSARTPKVRSGTPVSRDSGAPALPRAARCWRPSRLTAAASRACSAARTAGRCTSWPTTTTAPAPRMASCSLS